MRYETKIKDAALFGQDRPVVTRACDCPGCSGVGEYRAPKARNRLTDYYWFCLEHVRDYNLKWDYYAGMAPEEIESHIKQDSCWQRATWPLGGMRSGAAMSAHQAKAAAQAEESLRQKVEKEFMADAFENSGFQAEAPTSGLRRYIPAAAVAALAVLELKPPADFGRIKAQYKILAKRHHPDANGGSKEAEDRLKCINQAFTALRKLYEEQGAA